MMQSPQTAIIKAPVVRVRVKHLFLNAPEVTRRVDAGRLRGLKIVGSFVRTEARQSMRKRKRASDPGSAPSVHIGTLKNLLVFAYDPSARSMVIGPQILGSTAFYSPTVPEILEYGGERRISSQQARKLVARINRLAASGRDKAGRFLKWADRKKRIKDVPRVLRYPARPFMAPAFAKAMPRVEEKFAGIVDKAMGGGGLLGGG
jgi:hypothetical protein